MDELRELSELVNENGFTDFEFENENIRVRMSKMPSAPAAGAQPFYAAPAPAIAAPAAAPAAAAPSPAESAPEEDLHQITSPIVGTFYRAAGPDKEPYVKEGSKVGPTTVVCIVEAMKLMNEIEAETEGEVVKIYVENGQPVEYGQPLFGIRK
ncbi:MAG: acetyl-CoA carboxylase biotin carboxyl carrier protein [Chloracidobacterium sp.]|nr:acetyl-CoA carboxylase biotin carboxyl carrier protein [Chloracidobacterium sp.]